MDTVDTAFNIHTSHSYSCWNHECLKSRIPQARANVSRRQLQFQPMRRSLGWHTAAPPHAAVSAFSDTWHSGRGRVQIHHHLAGYQAASFALTIASLPHSRCLPTVLEPAFYGWKCMLES